MRKAGTKKEWMTSSEVSTARTGTFTGTCSVLISRAPFACWVFHIHCLPVTCTSIALRGGTSVVNCALAVNQKMKKNRKKVAAVQPISNSRAASSRSGPRFAVVPRR